MKNYFNIFSQDRSVTVLLTLLIFITLFYSIDKEVAKLLGLAALLMFFLQECFKYTLVKDLERYKLHLEKERVGQHKKVLLLETAKIVNEEIANIKRGLRTMLHFELGSWYNIQTMVGASLNKLRAIQSVNDLFFSEKLLEKLKELVKLISGLYLTISWLKEEAGSGCSRMLKDDLEKMRQEQEKNINEILVKKVREFNDLLKREADFNNE